jgi:uncharacterized protein YhaN
MDALDGLKALEQVVETIGEQLDDLYQRQDIPQIERVTLHSLEWTLAKLNGDLHTIDTEVKDLRLSVAAARNLDLQRLGDMSRIAKERDELRAQVAELTKKAGELPAESYQWQVGDVVEHDDGSMNCTRPVTNRSEGWVFLLGDDSGLPQPEWERRGWKLFRKASDLGVQQLTPRQVEISDSTGTDGEGQS